MGFHKDILQIDSAAEADKICEFIKKQVSALKRDGVVIGISGGVDSALCSLLCLRALGNVKVLGLILPEKESNPLSAVYAQKHAGVIGLNTISDDITATLEGFGTYTRRDNVIKEIFPEYKNHWKSKMTLPPDLLARDAFNFFTLKIKDTEGTVKTSRLNNQNARSILAASNTKQITRMMYLNYYAEMNNYLVCGTTNRSEYIQGFFVKYGDGGVDIEPIVHLYKMQVYQLSNYFGIIAEIVNRAPGPDTFTYEVTDEEMHFRIPFDIFDLLLYAWENKISVDEVSKALSLTEEQVKRAFRDITSKYNATNYLRLPALKLGSEILKE
jgi:NAD+ synthase